MSYSKLKGLALISKARRHHISERHRSEVEAIYPAVCSRLVALSSWSA